MGILDKINKKKKPSTTKESTEKKEVSEKKTVAKKSEEKTSVKAAKVVTNGNAYKILLRPIISEKALIGEPNGVYVFEIARKATKVDVKNAIRDVYGVTPKKVRVINMDGKEVRFGSKFGRRKDWKKAMVSLPKGKTIQIHEGV